MSIQLTLSGATFITSGTRIGDEVLISNAPTDMFDGGDPDPNSFEGQFLVTSITDEENLTFDGFLNGTALNLTLKTGLTGTADFQVVHNLSKDEQITEISNYAKGIANKRVTLVWPPAALMEDGTEVDGSFLAATLASAKSSYPAQQGFTNLKISGPYQLKYSNTYYKKSQLKTLAENGVLVLMQDSPGSDIYALHQKTTDTSTFINSELSCVTTIDKVSLDLISICKPYIGPYNISQDLLNFLNQICDNYLFKAKTDKYAKCGALILNGRIDSIRAHLNGENADVADGTIEITVSIEIGKPANWITFKLYVE